MRFTGSGTTPTSGSAGRILAVVVVIVLVLSAYIAIQVYNLQGQVASLENQNSNLQIQLTNIEQAQNYMLSQLRSLLTTSTQTSIFSFELQNVCVSVNPLCFTYPGYQGRYVFSITVANNGTLVIPITSSVFIEFKDATRSTEFGFNTTLPVSMLPGSSVYLNSTAWPQYVNATSKISPGDAMGVTVTIGSSQVAAATHVLACGSSTTTFLNYTSTQTATFTSCTS